MGRASFGGVFGVSAVPLHRMGCTKNTASCSRIEPVASGTDWPMCQVKYVCLCLCNMDQLLPRLWTPAKKSPPSLILFICVACQGSRVAMITAVLDFLFLRFFCRKLLYILVIDINMVFFFLLGIIQINNTNDKPRTSHPPTTSCTISRFRTNWEFIWLSPKPNVSIRWPMMTYVFQIFQIYFQNNL